MHRFVLSFIALLVSSFVFIWSMYEFVGWRNQLFLLLIALGSMGIFFSCFSVFSFFESKSFPWESWAKSLNHTPSFWWLSSLVFSLALIIGITLTLFGRHPSSDWASIAGTTTPESSNSGEILKNEGEPKIAMEASEQTLDEVNTERPNTVNQAKLIQHSIATSVSFEKYPTKKLSQQKVTPKRQYLSDGTPIPYEGERIFVRYE